MLSGLLSLTVSRTKRVPVSPASGVRVKPFAVLTSTPSTVHTKVSGSLSGSVAVALKESGEAALAVGARSAGTNEVIAGGPLTLVTVTVA